MAQSLPLSAWPSFSARSEWLNSQFDSINRATEADCIWWSIAAAAYGLTVVVVYDVDDHLPIVFGRGPNFVWIGWTNKSHFVALDPIGTPFCPASGRRDIFPFAWQSTLPPPSMRAARPASSPLVTAAIPDASASSACASSAVAPIPLPGGVMFGGRQPRTIIAGAGMETDEHGSGWRSKYDRRRSNQRRTRDNAKASGPGAAVADKSGPRSAGSRSASAGRFIQKSSSSAAAGVSVSWIACRLCGEKMPPRALVEGFCLVKCANPE